MPAFLTRPSRFLPQGPLDALVQVLVVFVAYETYRLSRGAIDAGETRTAFANADWIIDFERATYLDIERDVQSFTESIWGAPDVAAFLYINVQTTVTFTALAYIYVRHQDAFRFVRNMFVITWALAIVGFLLVPTAPPRLVEGLGINDSVAIFTGVDPSDRKVTKFYNPYAAVPSLHVAVATMVGISLSRLCARRPVRVFWALYAPFVTYIVMATGNHYLVDALAGALVVAIAALVAQRLGRLRPHAWRFETTARDAVEPAASGAPAG